MQLRLNLLNKTSEEMIYEEMARIEHQADKIRRGVFARCSDLSLKIGALEQEIEALKHQLWVISHERTIAESIRK